MWYIFSKTWNLLYPTIYPHDYGHYHEQKQILIGSWVQGNAALDIQWNPAQLHPNFWRNVNFNVALIQLLDQIE